MSNYIITDMQNNEINVEAEGVDMNSNPEFVLFYGEGDLVYTHRKSLVQHIKQSS